MPVLLVPKMGKLPFVVAPKLNSRVETLGSADSGKIEIERKGFLTVGEKAFMANVNSQDEVLKIVLKLASSVSKAYKINQQEAYQAVVDAMTDPGNCAHPVMDDYPEEIAQLANTMMAQEQKKAFMQAYCLLLYRVNENIEMDDVIDLHEDLVEELVQLFHDEEAKSTERLIDESDEKPDSEEIEAVEKK